MGARENVTGREWRRGGEAQYKIKVIVWGRWVTGETRR